MLNRYQEEMTLDPTVANYLLNFNLTHQKAQFMLDNSKQITLKFDLQVLNVLLALQKEVLENLTTDGDKLVPLLQRISRLQINTRSNHNAREPLLIHQYNQDPILQPSSYRKNM